jgi:hypothetical protein
VGLAEIIYADTRAILNDSVFGNGVAISLTAPDCRVGTLTGFSNDIGLLVDPDTGQAVSGRAATIAIHLADLAEQGLGIPENVQNKRSKPWVVGYTDQLGNTYTFKVSESHPDRTLGVVTCSLVSYDEKQFY